MPFERKNADVKDDNEGNQSNVNLPLTLCKKNQYRFCHYKNTYVQQSKIV